MRRLIEKIVFSGLVTDWRLAICPTSRSPLSGNATTDGVVRFPSALVITVGSPPSMTATTEFVVPRSMPMTFPMSVSLCRMPSEKPARERCGSVGAMEKGRAEPASSPS